jgi:hypothetical protein
MPPHPFSFSTSASLGTLKVSVPHTVELAAAIRAQSARDPDFIASAETDATASHGTLLVLFSPLPFLLLLRVYNLPLKAVTV